MDFSSFLSSGFQAWSDYNTTKQEAYKADQAQQNYQSSLNLANIASSNTIKIAIAGVVAVVVAFFIFKK
jgi:type IV secretory pathway VirB10-like protein